MALDQLAFAPILLYGFFIFHSGLQGSKQTLYSDPAKGYEVARAKIMETLLTNWKIWPEIPKRNSKTLQSRQKKS